MLVWAFECGSFVDWRGKHPLRAAQLRRGVLAMSAWLYLRFDFYMTWPYKLLQLTDTRLRKTTRAAIAQAFKTASTCCLDQGCARRLQRRLASWEEALSPLWLRALLAWGHQIPVSIGDVEHTHSSNNVIAGGRPTAAGFATRAFLKDGHLLSRAFSAWTARQVASESVRSSSGSAGCAVQRRHANLIDSVKSCKRALSPFDIFKKATSVSGSYRSKLGASSTSALREKFAALPPGTMADYEELSVMSKSIAATNRARIRAAAMAASLGDALPSRVVAAPAAAGNPSDGVSSAGALAIVPKRCVPTAMSHQSAGDVWLRMGRGELDKQADVVEPILPSSSSVPASTTAMALPRDVHSPMTHRVFEEVLRQLADEGKTVRQVCIENTAKFNAFCEAESALLGEVDYPTALGNATRAPIAN